MKLVFFSVYLISQALFLLEQQPQTKDSKGFSVQIIDANQSMAYSQIYSITNDSVKVVFKGGLVGEGDSILFKKKITLNEKRDFQETLYSIPFNRLKSIYSNPHVLDGDRKSVSIDFNGVHKTIIIENFYQKNMDSLFKSVNRLVPKNVYMYYKKG